MERFKVKKQIIVKTYEGTPLEGTEIDTPLIIEKGTYAEIFPAIYCIDDEDEKKMKEIWDNKDKDFVPWFLNTFMTIAFTKKPSRDYEVGEPFTQIGDESWIWDEDFNFMELPSIIKKYNLEVITCIK